LLAEAIIGNFPVGSYGFHRAAAMTGTLRYPLSLGGLLSGSTTFHSRSDSEYWSARGRLWVTSG